MESKHWGNSEDRNKLHTILYELAILNKNVQYHQKQTGNTRERKLYYFPAS